MSKVIRIPESTFSRLQTLATPFTDTPATVVERLLDYWFEGHLEESANSAPISAVDSAADREFSAMSPPDLHHARLLSACVGDENVSTWNDLVAAAHRLAIRERGDFDALAHETLSNIRKGSVTDSGFKPCSGTSFSIQNVDANNAWRHALHLARRYKLPILAEFEWRNKEAATFPGEFGKLEWSPD